VKGEKGEWRDGNLACGNPLPKYVKGDPPKKNIFGKYILRGEVGREIISK